MEPPPEQLVIVLNILDAINFHRTKNTPILLSASLDRNVLETDCRLPGIASTSFDCNLVWETDRRSVKLMKTENLPIKLECYALDRTGDQLQRTLIGHLVLPLRSVPMLPWTKADSVKARWFRVIGLATPEWKNQKPEVQLKVVITDKEYLNPAHRKRVGPEDTEKETDRSLVIFTNPEPSRLGSGEGLPIRLLEERGLLQVGSEDQECDIFLVKIVLKHAKQLERLLLPKGERMSVIGSFQMRYDLLGDNYPCSLERKPNGSYAIQEKIVINFRTSLHSLKRYFQEVFLIRLEVLHGGSVVGRCYFRFGDLIQDESLSQFLSRYHETSTLDVEKFYPIEPASSKYDEKQEEDVVSDRSSTPISSIKCKFCLKYLSSDRKPLQEPSRKSLNPDPQKVELVAEVPEVASVRSINLNQVQAPPVPIASPPAKTDIESILQCEDRDVRDIPRTFSYNLLLQSVKFTHIPPSGLWQISLYHPRADTPFTKMTMEIDSIESETVEFPNLQLKLFFSELPDRVLATITAECSKLSLHGPHSLFGFARLDNQSLVVGTKEKQAGILILENQTGESIGMATVFSFLDEVGINFNSRIPTGGPKVITTEVYGARNQLDDQLSYKMLEELKQWMMQQKKQFLIELKQKEVTHLTKLTAEWKKKMAKEREELSQRLEHAAALTVALEETKKSLAQQTAEAQSNEMSLKQLRAKLEQSYQQKLAEISEKTKRLEEELNHRAKLQHLRCQELEERNDSLVRDNDALRCSNEHLGSQLSEMKAELRNSESQRRELEQRLLDMEKSKQFYKQQWAKMVREVHKMKLEDEETLSDLIQGKERKQHKKSSSSWWSNEITAKEMHCGASKEQQELDTVHGLLFDERWKCDQQSRHHHPPQCGSKIMNG